MREHPNAAVVRRAYEAVARGDCAAVRAVAAHDALGGLYAALGTDDARGEFQARTIVPLALAAAGNLVVAIDHMCARRGGRPLDVEGVVVFDVVDRRIADVRRLEARRLDVNYRSP